MHGNNNTDIKKERKTFLRFTQIPAKATLSSYPYCVFLALLNLCPEDRGTKFLRNVAKFLLEHTALLSRTKAHQFFTHQD